MPVKSITRWNTSLWRGVVLGSISQMGALHTCTAVVEMARLHVGLGVTLPLVKWRGPCFFGAMI